MSRRRIRAGAPRSRSPVWGLSLVPVALALVDPLPAELGAQEERPRVAVLDFEDLSASRFGPDVLGAAAAEETVTHLVGSEAFSVIERSRLQDVLDEQGLGQTGAVEPGTAARIGEILGVQAIIMGSITEFSVDRTSTGLGPARVSYERASSVLDLRVVDTSTGEILGATEGSGTRRFGGAAYEDFEFARDYDLGVLQSALRPAVEDAVVGILALADRLAEVAVPVREASVVGRADDGSVYIDLGEDAGVEEGQRFHVHRVVDEIHDADGNLLDVVTERVAVVEVTRVLSQSSICRVVEGEAMEGDQVRPDA